MKKHLFSLFILGSSLAFSQSILSENYVSNKAYDKQGNVSFLAFKPTAGLSVNQSEQLIREVVQLNSTSKLVKAESKKGLKGSQHDVYRQFVDGVEVKFSTYRVHSRDGLITSINGKMTKADIKNDFSKIKSADQILQIGLQKLGSDYHINPSEFNIEGVYKPTGTLYILPGHISKAGDRYVYQYKLISKKGTFEDVYIDAINGDILLKDAILKYNKTKHSVLTQQQSQFLNSIEQNSHNNSLVLLNPSEVGIAETRYSGTREIDTRATNGGFELVDESRFVDTRNYSGDSFAIILGLLFGMAPNEILDLATPYVDADNNWTSAEYTATKDDAALDAHWGFAQAYDFFKEEYDRNGFDAQNGNVASFIHTTFTGDPNNAGWISLKDIDPSYSGGFMLIGDGNYDPQTQSGQLDALAAIDIIVHEFSHGVDSASGNLVYQRESGALDEGFADIWGATIEANKAPEKQRWIMGEDMVKVAPFGVRSFENPKLMNQPNTYLGQNWVDATPEGCPEPDINANDNCGVHTNSGVLNHWYYILTEGASGTNDHGYAYEVQGIGIKKAADLVYSTQLNYVESNSEFADVKNFTIQEAGVLYGADSPEVESVKRAWCAVGVSTGDECDFLAVSDLTSQNFAIYPNPVVDYINVKSNAKGLTTYQIVNAIGQVVKSGELKNGKIDATNLSSGVYVLTVKSIDGTKTQKFIKK